MDELAQKYHRMKTGLIPRHTPKNLVAVEYGCSNGVYALLVLTDEALLIEYKDWHGEWSTDYLYFHYLKGFKVCEDGEIGFWTHISDWRKWNGGFTIPNGSDFGTLMEPLVKEAHLAERRKEIAKLKSDLAEKEEELSRL